MEAYTTVVYVDGTYGTIAIDGVDFYVNWTNAVRGYTGKTSTAIRMTDRWYYFHTSAKNAMLLADDGVVFSKGVDATTLNCRQQIINPSKYAGRILTFSGLVKANANFALTVYINNQQTAVVVSEEMKEDRFSLVAITFSVPDDASGMFVMAGLPTATLSGSATMRACKLEVSDHQTLAHQDADGNWVLNDIPDPDMELLKCQKYYQLFSSEDKVPTSLADYRPAMRATPTTGPISIDGQTYYFADAQL